MINNALPLLLFSRHLFEAVHGLLHVVEDPLDFLDAAFLFLQRIASSRASDAIHRLGPSAMEVATCWWRSTDLVCLLDGLEIGRGFGEHVPQRLGVCAMEKRKVGEVHPAKVVFD